MTNDQSGWLKKNLLEPTLVSGNSSEKKKKKKSQINSLAGTFKSGSLASCLSTWNTDQQSGSHANEYLMVNDQLIFFRIKEDYEFSCAQHQVYYDRNVEVLKILVVIAVYKYYICHFQSSGQACEKLSSKQMSRILNIKQK